MSSEEERMTPALKRKKLRRIDKRLHEVESRPSFGSHQGEDKMIPEFDPQRTDQPVESWVRRIGRVLPLVRPDHRQVKLVANRPIGLARRWYDSQDCLAVSWKKNEKIAVAVLAMTPPENVKQVRQFLGLSGYFRKFAKDYSRIVEPLLTPLTRKDVKWCWEAVVLGGRAATGIREELHTDASALGLGTILLQEHDGKQRVVAYYSKQTTVDQREYHWYELETMAVVNALKHFCVYLLENPRELNCVNRVHRISPGVCVLSGWRYPDSAPNQGPPPVLVRGSIVTLPGPLLSQHTNKPSVPRLLPVCSPSEQTGFPPLPRPDSSPFAPLVSESFESERSSEADVQWLRPHSAPTLSHARGQTLTSSSGPFPVSKFP
ncbi:hypothetical protein GEV33_007454 [Tenebrio molitor]|uniref:Reverse transcriptase/retrotransposon-derived protein RNase H-like domain-containing protein n=1 Tax=Tenebrio molitor TaxID=7067 RepID=A0A8J6HJ73_TENMO|nr:hypothetical protein GEV33_007454 [Tenebrio molitor]